MYNIAVIPGDGTGPEVIAEGLKVLKAVSEKFNFKYHLEHFDLGGERYLKTGEILPESALKKLKEMDAIYLGAIGHPRSQAGCSGARNSVKDSVPIGSIYQSEACQALSRSGDPS